MRALCGAIITAGALIGLGLTALGHGSRYAYYKGVIEGGETHVPYVRFGQMDSGLLFCLWFLVFMAVVGLIIACIGLMYHHHRRHHELLAHRHAHDGTTPRATA
jgi:hypothetical protein